MKFLKMLFGRLTIIALAIILQVIVLAGIIAIFDQFVFAVQIALAIIGLLVCIHVVNRDMASDLKVPWIIVIFALPVFGVVIYIMFSQNKISFRQRKLYRQIHDESKVIPADENPRDDQAYEIMGDKYAGQSRYLSRVGGVDVHANTETVYYPSGETFFAALKEALSRAEKFIFMEYFIIESGEMWNPILQILLDKVAEGVEVRLIYDDIGCISKVGAGYYKKLRGMGINCVKFNRFTPLVSAVHNNRDHRKMTIIDGKVGFIGGINLADEYINVVQPFGHWKDTAVRLRGEGVKNLTVLFLQSYNVQMKACEDFTPYIPTEFEKFPETGFVQAFGDGPRPLYAELIAENAIVHIIEQAERYVYITTPYLIIDGNLMTALRSAAQRGVDVRIITPHIPDKKLIFAVTRTHYRPLMDAGVKIYEYTPGFIHAKSIIADDEVGIVGTINLDYRSLIHHYECGLWMCRTEALKDLKADMLDTLEKSKLQDAELAAIHPIARLVCNLIAMFFPML